MDSLSRNVEKLSEFDGPMTSPPQSWPLSWIARGHRALAFGRRARVLAEALAPQIPTEARNVLDIGCGDGTIASLIAEPRPELAVEGVEVTPRPASRVPWRAFDRAKLPYPDESFALCLFAHALHHTTN